jgi:hypothetical protein
MVGCRVSSHRAAQSLLASLLLVAACDRKPEPSPTNPAPPPTPTATTASAPPVPAIVVTLSSKISRPAPARLVAIGDLHGDLAATKRALRLAGAIDDKDAWIGGSLVVVQTGDEIDRGDDDRAILDFTERLRDEAKKAGGELILLSGNHEVMNVQLDFRYVTPASFTAFPDMKPGAPDPKLAMLPDVQRGRAAAFAPGGPYAKMLANRPIVMKVGDTIFVHGGILPKHVAYGLDRMVDEVAAWMRGELPAPPAIAVGDDSPIWLRTYSENPGPTECAMLGNVLASLGAKRMVMGHTVQSGGVTSACDGKAWRIDVGLSHFYGGPTQEVEVAGDAVQIKK